MKKRLITGLLLVVLVAVGIAFAGPIDNMQVVAGGHGYGYSLR